MSENSRAAFPVIQRKEPMDFATWQVIVLQDGAKYVNPAVLQRYYDEGWDAKECVEVLLDLHLYTVPSVEKTPKQVKQYQKVKYQEEFVNKRIAAAIYKECSKLLSKNLVPSAQQIVTDTQERVQKYLVSGVDS